MAATLAREGNRLIPVNPKAEEILGERCFGSLREIADRKDVEVVDIFRRSELAGPHVDEAIEIGAQAVWMQLGVVDEAAAERARAAGLRVVMNKCPAIEIPRLRASGSR